MKKILLLILCPLFLFSCKTTDVQPAIPAVSEEEALFARLKKCVMENDAAALRLLADDTTPNAMRSVINATELEGGQTLLHVAVLNESPEIVEILLKNGASKFVKNKAGKTPADYAKKSENRTIRELFGIKDEAKKSQPSSEKVLPGFTDASGDYEIIFGATDSPLIQAVKNQDYAAAKKLLQGGANVNDSDALGNNGLFYALSTQNSAIIHLLLENNINCNSRNKNGKLAFLYAVDKGGISTITTLLNAGASVNKPDSEGMTAELIAVRKRNGALLKFLESKGADLSSTDAKGNTLLHIAVKNDDIISAKFLLENGCDIYATNDAGVSVLDLMKKSRHGGIRALADDYE